MGWKFPPLRRVWTCGYQTRSLSYLFDTLPHQILSQIVNAIAAFQAISATVNVKSHIRNSCDDRLLVDFDPDNQLRSSLYSSSRLPSRRVPSRLPSRRVPSRLPSRRVPSRLPSRPSRLPSRRVPSRLPSRRARWQARALSRGPGQARAPQEALSVLPCSLFRACLLACRRHLRLLVRHGSDRATHPTEKARAGRESPSQPTGRPAREAHASSLTPGRRPPQMRAS